MYNVVYVPSTSYFVAMTCLYVGLSVHSCSYMCIHTYVRTHTQVAVTIYGVSYVRTCNAQVVWLAVPLYIETT